MTVTDETSQSRRDRETSAARRLSSIAESLKFCAPEEVANWLHEAQNLLNHHFAESVGRAQVPYVAEMLRKIEARKRQDPEFATALDGCQRDQE